jgi:probable HAF family extracellular repeat protein
VATALRVGDPYAPLDNGAFSGDPFVQHAFAWRNGTLADLGALSPMVNSSSYPNGINARGDEAGVSPPRTNWWRLL